MACVGADPCVRCGAAIPVLAWLVDLRASWSAKVAALPTGPGVYVFFGRERLPIYVGKSVNLRRRVRQHLGRTPGSERRGDEMAFAIADLSWFSAPTELHALLLEDELIKAHRPSFNRWQKKFLRQCYLVLTPDREPRLRVVSQAAEEPGSTLLGPFSDRHYSAELVALATRYFGLGAAAPSGDQLISMSSAMRATRGMTRDVKSVICEGNTCATRWSATGTHKGQFLGYPPSGKKATITGMTMTEFRNGLAVRDYVQWDALGLMRELGMVQLPSTAEPLRSRPEIRQ